MFAPQFSLRRLLAAVAGCAVLSLVLAQAVRGASWAQAAVYALVALAVLMLMQALMFGIVRALAVLFEQARSKRGKLAWLPPIAWLAASLAAVPALAGTGFELTLPTDGKPTASGLRLKLDNRWVDGRGYRPTRVKVECTAASTDRTLSIDYFQHGWEGRAAVGAHEVKIPAGASEVTAVLPAAEFEVPWSCGIKVWLDGVLEPNLSTNSPAGIGRSGQAQFLPAILLVERGDSSWFDNLPGPWRAISAQGGLAMAMFERLHTSRQAELPTNWLNYSGVDLLFLSLDDVRSLAVERRDAWQAIVRWTKAGGNLIVYDVGRDWRDLAALDQALEIPAGAVDSTFPRSSAGFWLLPPPVPANQIEQILQQVNAPFSGYGPGVMPPPNGVGAAPAESPTQDASNSPDELRKAKFVVRDIHFGRAIALAVEKPSSLSEEDWAWVLVYLQNERVFWSRRHGIAQGDNPNFYEWLVPGVGAAPVGMFQVLITLFVLAIGPLNYWLVWRKKRIALLLITVPACAAVVTLILVGYVLAADGLATRVRVRSLTLVDQPANRATTWSRLSLFTGLSPGTLSFPADTLVLPYEATPTRWSERRTPQRRITWNDREQRLSGDWLPSRTPTQFFTARAGEAAGRLEVRGGGGKLSARNLLGARIAHVLVHDPDGKAHYGSQIAPGKTVALAAVPPPTANGPWPPPELRAIQEALDPAQLSALSPVDPGWSSDVFGLTRRRYWGYSGDPFGAIGQDTSRLEWGLAQVGALVRGEFSPEPRTFLALTDRPPQVAVGVEEFQEEGSLHVIWGRW
jgi:hypothetical protein